MLGRSVPLPDLDEVTALALIGAVERELVRLRTEEAGHRDRADRVAWALATCARFSLSMFASQLRVETAALGPMPAEVAEDLARDLHRRGRRMPRSAANAAVLKAANEMPLSPPQACLELRNIPV